MKKKIKKILAKVQADLKVQCERHGGVDLFYVDRDEELEPEQVAVLLRGEDPYQATEFSRIDENESELSYQGAIDYLKELLDSDEYDALEDGDFLHEARFMVQDAQSTDLVTALLKNTRHMLMRYDLDLTVDTTYTSDADDRADMKRRIIDHLNLREDHPLRGQLDDLLTESSYGGQLYVLWYGNPADMVEAAAPAQHLIRGDDATPAAITFGAGAYLLVLDHLNGSGYDVEIEAPFRVPFVSGNLTTDHDGHGHGWDEIASVVPSAYAADVSIDLLTWTGERAEGRTCLRATSVLRNRGATYQMDQITYLVWPTTNVPILQSHGEARYVNGWACSWQGRVKGTYRNEILGLTYISEQVAMQAAEKHERSPVPA